MPDMINLTNSLLLWCYHRLYWSNNKQINFLVWVTKHISIALNGLFLRFNNLASLPMSRRSIVEMTSEWGEFEVSERKLTMPELMEANEDGR